MLNDIVYPFLNTNAAQIELLWSMVVVYIWIILKWQMSWVNIYVNMSNVDILSETEDTYSEVQFADGDMAYQLAKSLFIEVN